MLKDFLKNLILLYKLFKKYKLILLLKNTNL